LYRSGVEEKMGFNDNPIINSAFEKPQWHFELDDKGQPTGKKLPGRRESIQVVPVPAARRHGPRQRELALEEKTTSNTLVNAARMPAKGRGKQAKSAMDPQNLPHLLGQAIEALYKHYETVYSLWEKEPDLGRPPVFIVVCNNTATSKLLYDWISGYEITEADKEQTRVVKGARCDCFPMSTRTAAGSSGSEPCLSIASNWNPGRRCRTIFTGSPHARSMNSSANSECGAIRVIPTN
jgi:hypothetical protein